MQAPPLQAPSHAGARRGVAELLLAVTAPSVDLQGTEAPLESAAQGSNFRVEAVMRETTPSPTRVAVLGRTPPRGSQEHATNAIPAYTWEKTSPVRGKSSRLYVLQWGSPPENYPNVPLSRDPPNLIMKRRGLWEALRGASIPRGQRCSRGRIHRPVPTNLTEVGSEAAFPSSGDRGRRSGRNGRGGCGAACGGRKSG